MKNTFKKEKSNFLEFMPGQGVIGWPLGHKCKQFHLLELSLVSSSPDQGHTDSGQKSINPGKIKNTRTYFTLSGTLPSICTFWI